MDPVNKVGQYQLSDQKEQEGSHITNRSASLTNPSESYLAMSKKIEMVISLVIPNRNPSIHAKKHLKGFLYHKCL